jgi:hypothetical protein
MRQTSVVSLWVLACLFAIGAPSVAADQTATVMRNVNLRADASTDHPAIRLLTPSEPSLAVVDATPVGGYIHVRTSAGEDGWVWTRNVTVTGTAAPPPPPPSAAPSPSPSAVGGSFAGTNPTCPPVGTHNVNGQPVAYALTSDAGLRNRAKRHVPAAATPVTLTLDDLRQLQDDVNHAFADASTTKTAFTPNRDGLKGLATTSGSVSEGDLVQINGFLTVARAEGAEGVNCAAVDGTDIHLDVGPQGATEFAGVVAEMIPQLPRPNGWDPTTLTRIASAQLPVLVVGGLTYDNEHFVNADAHHPKSGQPKRMSLWEIHPILEFFVCPTTATCDPAQHDQWQTLTAWATAHPGSH